MKRLLSAGLLAATLAVAACDSGTNLAATPAVRTPITANATLSTVTQGSTTVSVLTIPQSAFPQELLSAPSIQAVFGTTGITGTPTTVAGTTYLSFVVPPTHQLTPESSGKTKLLFSAGSTVRMGELTVTRS